VARAATRLAETHCLALAPKGQFFAMIPEQFPGRGKVAALKTRPETVLADVGEVMHLAGYQDALPRDHDTILKINISWQTWYPACSTTPWQLEGVIRTLQADGYSNLIGAHNGTVVVDARVGERNNKHKYVVDRYGVANVHLYEPHIEWVTFTPSKPFLVLDQIFPEGVKVPKLFYDRNIIQLPTVKTHVFTTIRGDEKRLRRSAQQSATPHPRRHRRDAGRPLADSAGHPLRSLCGHGRHVCR